MDFGMPPREPTAPILLSASQLIRYRDEKRTIRFTLENATVIEGTVQWFDSETYNILQANGEELTLLKRGVLYYRAI